MARSEQDNIPQSDQAQGCASPREVYDLIGHAQAERQFADMLTANTLHHAWLISGPAGIGKATLAYRMIRTVLGGVPLTSGRLDVTANDPVAQRVQSLGHGDFLLIRRPWDEKTKKLRSDIPVSEARKIGHFFAKKPSEGGWRVCLIDSMDEMNRNAANAVLKTLEEPPDKALIILLSRTPGRLLPTIRSRCLSVPLQSVDETELRHWLAGQVSAADEDIEAAIKLAGGAPGRALAIVRNADTVLRPLRQFMARFPRSGTDLAHSISDALSPIKMRIEREIFWDCLGAILYAQSIYAATGEWRGPYAPISLHRPPVTWIDLREKISALRRSQETLNMNAKQVLLESLLLIGES